MLWRNGRRRARRNFELTSCVDFGFVLDFAIYLVHIVCLVEDVNNFDYRSRTSREPTCDDCNTRPRHLRRVPSFVLRRRSVTEIDQSKEL